MKLQIDTEQKTIKLDGNENLGELVEVLEGIFLDGFWKEFELQVGVTITPIVIEEAPYCPRPWLNPVIT